MATTKFVCFDCGKKGVAWVRKDAIRAIIDRGNGATVVYEATRGQAEQIETATPADTIMERLGTKTGTSGEMNVALDPFR